jgi:hypothetical protein
MNLAQRAQTTKDSKHESGPADRSTKLETNSNVQKAENFKQLKSGFAVLGFLWFWLYLAPVCFGFRASDLHSCVLGAINFLEAVFFNIFKERI